MKSKFKLNEKVQVTSIELYPMTHHLMGTITRITDMGDNDRLYDIHYGIIGIDDLKNVPEEDIKIFE